MSFADMIAYAVAGIIIEKIGAKSTLAFSFIISTIGGILILAYGLSHQDSFLFPILFFVSKFGIACAFGVVYIGNAKIFPAEIVATTMGICQTLARLAVALQFFFQTLE